ncbi:phosphotransferase family protein [Spiroplasma taiwanense]|uniref:Putative choline kinase n=1 Tax=Spiroplasma taiwanense CT-1 TaxID=1276220 RepID=S5LZA9_9MOLU|nr:phosphotransferase [Spiroplasma taiwanense]AGR41042.1 putative choline kinase [Spiroplasma taiwanense CT-1]
MKFKGLTNEITVEKNILIKKEKAVNKLYLDKKNEFIILKEFKQNYQKIMIKSFDFYFQDGLLISKFKILKNFKSINEIDITDDILDLVIYGIKKFHKIKIKSKIKKFNYSNYLDIFKNNIDNFLYDFSNEYEKLIKKIAFTKNLKQVISHNDLVPGNILIKNKKIKLIDYDFVMLNNIFFDIASFITETLNDNNLLINSFIKKCIEKKLIKKEDINYLKIIIEYQDLLWTLWANYMFEKTNENIYKIICQEKYLRLKNRFI